MHLPYELPSEQTQGSCLRPLLRGESHEGRYWEVEQHGTIFFSFVFYSFSRESTTVLFMSASSFLVPISFNALNLNLKTPKALNDPAVMIILILRLLKPREECLILLRRVFLLLQNHILRTMRLWIRIVLIRSMILLLIRLLALILVLSLVVLILNIVWAEADPKDVN